MSNAILIIGESGTGKSTAIRTLDPKETYIVNILNKPLPFKGYNKLYKEPDNLFASDKWLRILKCLEYIDKEKPEIKNIVIDDWQYILANEFMARALERGYDKFSEMARTGWHSIRVTQSLRNDMTVFVLAHSDTDSDGTKKLRTIGKLLNEKVSLEGMFTIVLHALIIDGKHQFLTNNDGTHMAKSPIGMFQEELINNDLNYVLQKVKEYYE